MKKIIAISVLVFCLVITHNAFADDNHATVTAGYATATAGDTTVTAQSCDWPNCNKVDSSGKKYADTATASTDPHSQGQKNNTINALGVGGKIRSGQEQINQNNSSRESDALSTKATSVIINSNLLTSVGEIKMEHDCSILGKELHDIVQEQLKDHFGDFALIKLNTAKVFSSTPGSFFGYHWSQNGEERCLTTATAYTKK